MRANFNRDEVVHIQIPRVILPPDHHYDDIFPRNHDDEGHHYHHCHYFINSSLFVTPNVTPIKIGIVKTQWQIIPNCEQQQYDHKM